MRLPFTVVHSDSESREFPATNLHDVTPHSPGWISAPFPLFPQEIVIAFTGAVNVRNVKLLSHELFVCSKVHINIGTVRKYDVPNYKTAKYTYLGYVKFQNNGQWTLREQQTIQINQTGTFMKISFEAAHTHNKNLCNQIGIVDMVVEGDVNLPASEKVLKAGQQGLDFMMLKHGIDLEEDFIHAEARMEGMGVDALRMLRRVVALKESAQAREDFDEAQRLSEIEKEVVSAGQGLEEAEAAKAAAVAREDYSLAKELKAKTDDLKEYLRQTMAMVDRPKAAKRR